MYRKKNYKKCFIGFFIRFKKLTLSYELCELYESCKFYELCVSLNSLKVTRNHLKSHELLRMNHLKHHKYKN